MGALPLLHPQDTDDTRNQGDHLAMNVWNIAVYLLLGLGIILLVLFLWALSYVAQDDEEMEAQRLRRDGT